MKIVLKESHKACLVAAAALLVLDLAIQYIPSGSLTHFLAAIPAAVIGITVLARVNDLSEPNVTTRWHFRRMGLVFAGIASVAYIAGGLVEVGRTILWREVLMLWGIGLTWITSKPTWWKYISGKSKLPPKELIE